MSFRDRRDAGERLAEELLGLDLDDPIVVGLPRGGVPVAAAVAERLGAPLDVILVRKLGVPSQPELAMGAIGEDDVRVLNEEVLDMTGVSEASLEAVERAERAELEDRARRFRSQRVRLPLRGRSVVIVDDGIATGSTARAAVHVARAEGAGTVILAVPVAPPRTIEAMRDEADVVVCLEQPERFWAVGQFYADFDQVSDDEVVRLLRAAPPAPPRPS